MISKFRIRAVSAVAVYKIQLQHNWNLLPDDLRDHAERVRYVYVDALYKFAFHHHHHQQPLLVLLYSGRNAHIFVRSRTGRSITCTQVSQSTDNDLVD